MGVILWLLCGTALSFAQDTVPAPSFRPDIEIVRTTEPPVVDGLLDDAPWTTAAVINAFAQVDPLEGAEPSEHTEVRLLYDDRKLYIGIRCFDSEPDKISARQMQRDAGLRTDDRVGVMIDTFLSRRNGYFFQIGAGGGRRDGLVEVSRSTNYDWDGLWGGKTSIDEEGWVAEIAIPFTTLAFDPDIDQWGLNIERSIRRNNERIRWASPRRNLRVTSVANAGTTSGLRGLQQGKGVMVKPFLAIDADLYDGDSYWKPGMDLFYNITPSTTLAITINTDFADAEVDQQRVNLTRFPLFFPEKRDFFLQDANVFSFGGLSRNPLPFHSRRIGIVEGEEKDILAGVKITGREGDVRFGFLDVQMKDDSDLGETNLGVARVLFDVVEESSIGLIGTVGDPATPGDNALAGADFNYRSSQGDDVIIANIWAQTTQTDPEDEAGHNSNASAIGGRLVLPNEPLGLFFYASNVGDEFNPALGFVSRIGRRQYILDARYRWRPEMDGIRRVDLSGFANIHTLLNNDLETARFTLAELDIETDSDDELEIRATWERDNLFEPFEIIDGVTIPVGEYGMGGVRARLDTALSRPWSVDVSYGWREFFTGHRRDLATELQWRPTANFFGEFEVEQNDINLAEGDFQVLVLRTRINFLFTPDLAWTNTVQWDNASEVAGINSKIRWEVEPGQELFVVYNESLQTMSGVESLESRLTFKVGLTFLY